MSVYGGFDGLVARAAKKAAEANGLALIKGLGIEIPIDDHPLTRIREQNIDPRSGSATYLVSPFIEQDRMYVIPAMQGVDGPVLVIPTGQVDAVLGALAKRGCVLERFEPPVERTVR